MKTRKEEPFDINEVPAEVFQEVEAASLPTEVMTAELKKRGFTVEPSVAHYDEATGLFTNGSQWWTEDGKEVTAEEAYKRASGGW